MGKEINRNASASANGWDFQVTAAIQLLIENIKRFERVKIEGTKEDIEIFFPENKTTYAQAKSVVKMGEDPNKRKKLIDAIQTLKDDYRKDKQTFELIYITNIDNPLSSSYANQYEYNNSYRFEEMPLEDQESIEELFHGEVDVNKFRLYIIRFFGDNKSKYVKDSIQNFLRTATGDTSFSDMLFDKWFRMLMFNAAEKPDNQVISLSRSQFISPIILFSLSNDLSDEEFSHICCDMDYDDIYSQYRQIIDRTVLLYDFYGSIMGDYSRYCSNKSLKSDKESQYSFVNNCWKDYEKHFSSINNSNEKEVVTKIAILQIVKKRNKLSKIKEAIDDN